MRMQLLALSLVPLAAAGTCRAAGPKVAQAPKDFCIIGYLPDYRFDTFNPRQAALATDIVYMAAEPKETGELDLSRVKPAHLQLLGQLRTEYHVRTHLGLGGWGRCSGYPAMARDPKRRERFAEVALTYCQEHEFAGVDLDWEFPKDEAEEQDFVQLLAVMHTRLAADKRLLSIALAPWQRFPPTAWGHVDRVNLMSYDHAGRHATYDQAEKDIERVLALGIPREKLLLGLPCYARHVRDKERTLTWLEIVGRHNPPLTSDELDGFYYNGPATIARKTKLAGSQRLGGVFFWELGQDTDGARSLVRAARGVANLP